MGNDINNETNKKYGLLKRRAESIIDIAKNKKSASLKIIIVSFLLILSLALFFNKKQIEPVKTVDNSNIEVAPEDNGLASWQAQSSGQLSFLASQIVQLNAALETQKKYSENLEKKINEVGGLLNQQRLQIEDIKISNEKLINEQLKIAEPDKLRGYPGVKTYTAPPPMPDFKLTDKRTALVEGRISPVNERIAVSEPPAPKLNKAPMLKELTDKQGSSVGLLPTGSFFKATLLNGLEAGTGQESESNPQPILMRILDNAFLPNEYRYEVKSCFVIGSGYGSLSSERVYIRTARISCVGNRGRSVITANLEGYVVDSDGKIGLRGKLISRQGAKLGMAMLAGFANGIATAFGNSQGTATITPFGVTNTVNSTQSLKQSGLGGINGASQELAQFYIRQAETIFPVIEINNGRNVIITLSQGTSLHWQNNENVTSNPITDNQKDQLKKV